MNSKTTKTNKPHKQFKKVSKAAPKDQTLSEGFWNLVTLFKNKKEYVVFCLMMLGVLSLLAGVGLIIAAHWASIPGFVRVLGGLAVLGVSLGITGRLRLTGWAKCSELALFVSYLLIGGNIALIQQTYNLAISWRDGCLIWAALGFPLAIMAAFPLVRWCTVVLVGLGLWSYLPDIDHIVVAAILFLCFVGTLPLTDTYWDRIRSILFFSMWGVLLIGDLIHDQELGVVLDGFVFLLSMISLGNKKQLLFYNLLFVYAGIRVVMLFWHAHNLNDVGIRLIVCGAILLLLSGLYYKFFDKLQDVLRKWIKHE